MDELLLRIQRQRRRDAVGVNLLGVEAVGLEETPKPESLAARGGVWFQCGPQQLHVGVEDGFAPARKAPPAFRVLGLERVRERLVSFGATPQDDDAIPGLRRFYVDDPFGNRLELMEPRP